MNGPGLVEMAAGCVELHRDAVVMHGDELDTDPLMERFATNGHIPVSRSLPLARIDPLEARRGRFAGRRTIGVSP